MRLVEREESRVRTVGADNVAETWAGWTETETVEDICVVIPSEHDAEAFGFVALGFVGLVSAKTRSALHTRPIPVRDAPRAA